MGVNNIIFIWYEKAICQHNFQIRDSGRKKYEKLKIDNISLSVISYERICGRIQTEIILDFRPAIIHHSPFLNKVSGR
ncbi:MAG: hypothetical protein DRI57_14890 [Deltaproteobacteria bacterium]|nr:MAG: hypothetical protein DRI57_14890 [Deltaproteobacteria bacterium]